MNRALAITGGTGSGKSSLAEALGQRGALVLDADLIGHEVLLDPGIVEGLVDAFGERILDPNRAIDRRALGSTVFGNRHELDRLNAIVHPELLGRLRERLDRARNDPGVPLIVVDAALIAEWGIEDWFDCVVVVTAEPEHVRERLRAKGLTDDQIERRIGSQLDEEARVAGAGIVIRNDTGVADLESAADRLWEGYAR